MKPIVLTSDWHIRDDTPLCRTDDYEIAQIKKLSYIDEYMQSIDALMLLHAGDVCDKGRPVNSQMVESLILGYAPTKIYGVPGNHDLPYHKLNNLKKSSLNVLIKAKQFIYLSSETPTPIIQESNCILYGFPYGTEMVHLTEDELKRYTDACTCIAITHQLVFEKSIPYGVKKGVLAIDLLKQFSEYKIILTGDNHQSFVVEHEGRYLVNPGSLLRMDADQVDHKPSLYVWDGETIKREFIPIEEGVVSREHIEVKQERDGRIDAYVERMNADYEVGLSFEKNIDTHLLKNKVRQNVEDKIREAIE